jgi:hypothetical protein
MAIFLRHFLTTLRSTFALDGLSFRMSDSSTKRREILFTTTKKFIATLLFISL